MVVVLLIADHGRAFVEDRIFAEIPLLLILAAGAGALALPRLCRSPGMSARSAMTTGGPVLHYAATSAWITVPIRAMILGAAMATLDLYWEPGTQWLVRLDDARQRAPRQLRHDGVRHDRPQGTTATDTPF